MAIVQVVGLPGAGKTTGINAYLAEIQLHRVQYLDIAHYSGPNKEWDFKRSILEASHTAPVIAESACGQPRLPGYVICIDPPPLVIYQRLLERDGVLDEDYLSLLKTCMTRAHRTIDSAEELPAILHDYFRTKA